MAFFFPFDVLNWLSEIKLIQTGMAEYLQIKSVVKDCPDYDFFVVANTGLQSWLTCYLRKQ